VMYYTKMLGSLGGLSQGKSTELKGHLDIYYVYYLASNVQLAKGNMVSYCYEGTNFTGEKVVNHPRMKLNDALIESCRSL